MKIYLDYVFFVNLLFDFILLLGVSIVLKRNVSKKRLFFGSIIGGLSGFLILLPISSFLFFVLKILFGLIMLIITFSYKSISYTLNNFPYYLQHRTDWMKPVMSSGTNEKGLELVYPEFDILSGARVLQ